MVHAERLLEGYLFPLHALWASTVWSRLTNRRVRPDRQEGGGVVLLTDAPRIKFIIHGGKSYDGGDP